MTERKKTCVYFGPNLSAWQKGTYLDACCEQCPRLRDKSVMVYDMSPEGFHFEGNYTCMCQLNPDSIECIYVPEEDGYID